MKKIYRQLLWGGLLLLWLIFIFLFSAQNAVESGGLSDGICYRLVSAFNRLFGLGWGSAQLESYAVWLGFPVRKAAHMTEYAVLALLVLRNLILWEKFQSRKVNFFLAWLAAVLYAMTDEFHQTFVSGRCGTPVDVCIDGTGAFLGLLLFVLLGRFYRKLKMRGREQELT